MSVIDSLKFMGDELKVVGDAFKIFSFANPFSLMGLRFIVRRAGLKTMNLQLLNKEHYND